MPNKLDLITSIMAQMKYDAVGVGASDSRFGDEFYKKAAANKLTVVDASPVANKSAVPYIIKNVGGVRVGIISFGVLPADTQVNEYQLRKVRFELFKEVRSKCDVLVLLDQGNVATDEWLTRNAQRLGSPDIVIGGAGRVPVYAEQTVGKAHIMPSLVQAKELGVIDVETGVGDAPKLTYTRVMLNETYAEDKDIDSRIKQGIQALGLPSALGANPEYEAIRSNNKPYYSPLLCKACHQKQYTDWALTKHAKALRTLTDAKSTTPDCLRCHSELFRQSLRYIASDSPIGGVECATCHASVLPHGMERKGIVAKSKVDPQMCLGCHTKDRSPSYDEKTYFPRVAHSGAVSTTTAAAK